MLFLCHLSQGAVSSRVLWLSQLFVCFVQALCPPREMGQCLVWARLPFRRGCCYLLCVLGQGRAGSPELCKGRQWQSLQHHVLHHDLVHLSILHQHHLYHIWEQKKITALSRTDRQQRHHGKVTASRAKQLKGPHEEYWHYFPRQCKVNVCEWGCSYQLSCFSSLLQESC